MLQLAVLHLHRKGFTAWWRITPIPISWHQNSTRTCVKNHKSPQSTMLYDLKKGAPEWETCLSASWGRRLSPTKENDIEFSLVVWETSLRTTDSKLGSESGSCWLSRRILYQNNFHCSTDTWKEYVAWMWRVSLEKQEYEMEDNTIYPNTWKINVWDYVALASWLYIFP